MRIVISGASGLIGSALVPFLTSQGAQAVPLDRGKPFAPQLQGTDVVVNLAGENIAEGRWTEAKKRRIRDSRVQTTKNLVTALQACKPRPQLLVNASAVGFYGDRGEEVLHEDSAPGSDFLASVCREWEAVANAATTLGIRVVTLRLGVVLSPKGGAIKKLRIPFKLGLGGKLGSGNQWMSWIALDDVPPIIWHIVHHVEIQGPVNAVSPTPLRNVDFTKQLGKIVHRPTVLPVPAFALRLLFGEMAEALLSSTRALPGRLQRTGYTFQRPTLGAWVF